MEQAALLRTSSGIEPMHSNQYLRRSAMANPCAEIPIVDYPDRLDIGRVPDDWDVKKWTEYTTQSGIMFTMSNSSMFDSLYSESSVLVAIQNMTL